MNAARGSLLALVLLVLAGCRSTDVSPATSPLDDIVRVHETATGDRIGLEAMLDALASHDVVFLGETHLDDTTHRVELAALEGLADRRGNDVVLSLEMFEADVQPVLDDYLAGRIDEATFLSKARPWRNYRTAYRPLIEAARRRGIPVVAANTPIGIRRKVARGGADAVGKLSAEERALLPAEFHVTSRGYWERVDRTVRGHPMASAGSYGEARVYSTQSLWDNSMGDACARALARHPGHLVLHVVGAFHVEYRQGTAEQFKKRAPEATSTVVTIRPRSDLARVDWERDRDRADWLVYAHASARDISGRMHAVYMTAELEYRLHVPHGASPDRPVPLLVWMDDADVRPEDAARFWNAAVGKHAAVAVVAPPLPQRAADLVEGGRWFRPSNVREDLGRLTLGIERIVEYVTRRYPVQTDPVIAGRGDGASAALWMATYAGSIGGRAVAWHPKRVSAMRLAGLPDRPSRMSSALVLHAADEQKDAEGIAGDLAELGLTTRAEMTTGVSSEDRWMLENAVREALGVEARDMGARTVRQVRVELSSDRARLWADVQARLREDENDEAWEVLPGSGGDAFDVTPATVGGRVIPTAPGDFGGTTILVVPKGEDPAPWLAIQEDDPVTKRNRFSRVRMAFEDGNPSLRELLATLKSQGRKNVLIIPARFCADEETMQALERSIRDMSGFTINWLPGLGSRL